MKKVFKSNFSTAFISKSQFVVLAACWASKLLFIKLLKLLGDYLYVSHTAIQ